MTDDSKAKKITFHCPAEVADRLDRLASKADIPRSRLILNMVESMLGYLEVTEKVGMLQFSILIRNLQEKMKEWGKSVREKNSLNEFKIKD